MLAALMGKQDMSDVLRLAVFAAAFGVVVLLSQLIKAVASFLRINRAMQVGSRVWSGLVHHKAGGQGLSCTTSASIPQQCPHLASERRHNAPAQSNAAPSCPCCVALCRPSLLHLGATRSWATSSPCSRPPRPAWVPGT